MLTVCNPFSLETIGELPFGIWEEADRWLTKADKLHRDRSSWLPAYRRIEILHKTANSMRDRFEELAFQIANEGGKPLIDARIEVDRAIDGVNWQQRS
tara:strand:- start:192 stop:485 length:294 start_codon:yes stop_codon:yes gene_type:complete